MHPHPDMNTQTHADKKTPARVYAGIDLCCVHTNQSLGGSTCEYNHYALLLQSIGTDTNIIQANLPLFWRCEVRHLLGKTYCGQLVQGAWAMRPWLLRRFHCKLLCLLQRCHCSTYPWEMRERVMLSSTCSLCEHGGRPQALLSFALLRMRALPTRQRIPLLLPQETWTGSPCPRSLFTTPSQTSSCMFTGAESINPIEGASPHPQISFFWDPQIWKMVSLHSELNNVSYLFRHAMPSAVIKDSDACTWPQTSKSRAKIGMS